MAEHEDDLGAIRFNAADWDFLRKADAFLQPFASATLYAEGDKSSISQSLVIMDSLLVHYEQEKVSASGFTNSMLRIYRSSTRRLRTTIAACFIQLIWAGSYLTNTTR